MSNYHLFFLCGFAPPNTAKVIDFVEWVVQAVPGKEKLHLIARQREDPIKLGPTLQGDWEKCRAELRRLHIQNFSISNKKWNTSGTGVFLYFENVHTIARYIPQSIHSVDPEPVKISIPEGIKILSLALRRDVWAGCEQSGLAEEITREVESLFLDLDWTSGYAHSPARLITGRYSLIGAHGDNKIRIVDFDYAHRVEQIYKTNFLSNSLLQQLKDPSRLNTLPRNQIRYDILSKDGRTKGGVLHLLDYSPKTIEAAAFALEPLVWQGAV